MFISLWNECILTHKIYYSYILIFVIVFHVLKNPFIINEFRIVLKSFPCQRYFIIEFRDLRIGGYNNFPRELKHSIGRNLSFKYYDITRIVSRVDDWWTDLGKFQRRKYKGFRYNGK